MVITMVISIIITFATVTSRANVSNPVLVASFLKLDVFLRQVRV